MAIGRRLTKNLFYEDVAIIGSTNTDEPKAWASVITPADSSHLKNNQLFFSDAGTLVAIRRAQECFLAYDVNQDRFLGHNDIAGLSPFVLIGPDTTPSQRDIDGIISLMRSHRPPVPGYPLREQIASGLTHPNPKVQEIAQQLLDLYEPGHSGKFASAQ